MGKAKPPINVVGDVGGRIAIMVDDMIDDVKSFVDAAHILKERGAYKIYALATHGILSADAPRLIQESPIDEVRLFTLWPVISHLENEVKVANSASFESKLHHVNIMLVSNLAAF